MSLRKGRVRFIKKINMYKTYKLNRKERKREQKK